VVGKKVASWRKSRHHRSLQRLDDNARRAATRAAVARTGVKPTTRRAKPTVAEHPVVTLRNTISDRREARRHGLAIASRRPAAYVLLSLVIAVLCIIGLVMVLSASSVSAIVDSGSGWGIFRKQLVWLVVAAGACWTCSHIDYRFWRRFANAGVAASTIMLTLVVIPGIGTEIYGSSRWLGVGPLSLQPSETAKLAVVVWVAALAERRAHQLGSFKDLVLPVTLMLSAFAVLLLAQPDLSAIIVLALIAYVIAYAGGAKFRHILTMFVIGGAAACAVMLSNSYQRRRFTAFLDPFSVAEGDGYQVVQSLVGLGSGQYTGVGLGMSRAKWGFLPQAHTDFIFTVIGEELGLVGSLSVLALFAAFCALGIRAALRAPDRFGSLVAVGITAWVVIEVLINVGGVTNSLPVTGLPLPFVSAGGSSLVVTMAAAGILLNITRQGVARQSRVPGSTRKSRASATPRKSVSAGR
jgi:cell division protein FtsW